MKLILVPTDFSRAAQAATQYAAALAKEFASQLYLFYVCIPSADGEVASARDKEWRMQMEGQVQEEAKGLEDRFNIKVGGSVQTGTGAATIVSIAQDLQASLLVMGMKGRGGAGGIGSMTTATIRRSPIPVLVVPEGARYEPLRSITLATDFDDRLGASSFRILLALAGRFGATVQVLHVGEEEEAMETHEIVGKMQLEVIFTTLRHTYYTIEEANVEKGITDFLENHPTDLLVMVAHHHSLLHRMVGTLHTVSMSYKTRWPLLVLVEKYAVE